MEPTDINDGSQLIANGTDPEKPINDNPEKPIHVDNISDPKQSIDENKLKCSCGKIYLKKNLYSVYGVNFCSMACLRIFKSIEDDKRNPRTNSSTFINLNYGGGPTVS